MDAALKAVDTLLTNVSLIDFYAVDLRSYTPEVLSSSYFRVDDIKSNKRILTLKVSLSRSQSVLESYWEKYLTSNILSLTMSQH
jgi:hypothetical protein